MRSRQRSGGVAAMMCALLLATTAFAVAASAEPPLSPMTQREKLELLREQAARERDQLARQYPFLHLPDMTPMRVVDDDEWADRIVECLQQFGVDARRSGDAVVAPRLDTRTLPGDVVSRTCELRYPRQSQLRYVLGPFELQQLWSYYVFELQPCLKSIGVHIDRSPSFAEYLAGRGTDDAWHPYRAISELDDLRDLNYYDGICPRFPEWLRA